MKTNKDEIDQIIKETLTNEEAKFYDDLEEQTLLQMLGGLFQTKYSWLIIIMNIVNLVMFVLSIYCVIQFLNTDTTNELIKWANGAYWYMISEYTVPWIAGDSPYGFELGLKWIDQAWKIVTLMILQ